MLRRLFPILLSGTLLLLLAGGAGAAVSIDPSLDQALTAAKDGGMVRVLLLLDERPDPSALEPTLAGLTPSQRRARVIAYLRDVADRSQADVLTRLQAAAGAGHVRRVKSLYLANAVTFRADREGVALAAAAKANGTLYFDRSYDLLSGVMAPVSAETPADAGLAPAAKAVAWSVDWIGAPDVWALGYDGSGVVVGHLDSGVYLTHPDIANRLWTNPGEIAGNGLDDDGNGYVDDVHGYDFGDDDGNPNDDSSSPGHGTHTAGSVAGDGTGGTQTGVAPGAQIMACKVFASDGTGTLGMIWEAYQYVLENGARLITMSLGVPGDVPASLSRAERDNCNDLRAAGITVINAAGNDHYTYSPPIECGLTARVPAPWNPIAGTPYSSRGGVVTVGGTGYMSDSGYSYSSRGPVTWGNVPPWYDWPYNPGPGLTKPDVCAPAVNVNSLVIPSGYSGNSWSGTSMATPHVAGLAALMLDKNPSLSPAGLDSIMEQTAVELGVAGKDNQFGSGRIDALAAVNAVPTVMVPHLVVDGLTVIDAGGDGVIDPGEDFQVIFRVANNSVTTDATGVSGAVAVQAGDPATVTDGSGAFGDIAMGAVGDNSSDTFGFTADPSSTDGDTFTMYLTLTAQNGYEKTIDVQYYIGLPEWRTHDAGHVLATITDHGSLGFMNSNQVEGDGFGPPGDNGLFIGSLWSASGTIDFCNADYDEPETSSDWAVVTTPNGRVKDLGQGISDQDFVTIFDDSGHPTIVQNLQVTLESFAFASPPDDDYVILRYTYRNKGTHDLQNYYIGVFCDWDVGDAGANRGATDTTRAVSYIYPDGGGECYGVALRGDAPLANVSLINNPTYVYPNQYIEDGDKLRFLKGTYNTPSTPSADDWSAVTSAGPFHLAPGDSVVVEFAMVWGADEADFLANVDAARAVDLTGPTAVGDGPQPVAFRLAPNMPNPFNPRTTIRFSLDRDTMVRLGVYDLQGRLVRTLVDGAYTRGEHQVVWDGADAQGNAMPSGLYFVKVDDGRRVLTRKMMLVR